MGIYRAVTVSARYVPSSRASSTPITTLSPRFLAALGAVITAHPMLRVGVAAEDTNAAYFTHIPSIDLTQQVSVRPVSCASEAELNREVSRIQALVHNKLWESAATRPPWHITLVRDDKRDCEDAIFSYHHSLMDGTSGRLFHEFLLAALRSANPANAKEVLSFPDPPAVLPETMEDAMRFTVGPLYMVGVLWNEFGPTMLKPAPQAVWGSKPVDFAMPYVTRIRPVDIPAVQTKTLVSACRAHKTTLTGLLQALAFAYFTKTIPEEDVPGFSAATPISLRKSARADIDIRTKHTMRVLLCSMDSDFSLSDIAAMRAAIRSTDKDALDAAVWDVAARVRGEIVKKTSNIAHNNVAGMLKHVGDWFKLHKARDGKPRANSWECSNVGALAAAEGGEGAVTVERVMFSNGAMVYGAAVGLNTASAPGGALTIALSWQEGVVVEEFVEGLGKTLEDMVAGFCASKTWKI